MRMLEFRKSIVVCGNRARAKILWVINDKLAVCWAVTFITMPRYWEFYIDSFPHKLQPCSVVRIAGSDRIHRILAPAESKGSGGSGSRFEIRWIRSDPALSGAVGGGSDGSGCEDPFTVLKKKT